MNIVIIGNSAAGLSALQNFRKVDKDSKVVMISKEGFLPYSRVLLPYVLRGKLPYEGMTIRTQDCFERLHAECMEGTVTKLDAQAHKVFLEDGRSFDYDKLLIATGSYALTPPIEGAHQEGVCNMWTKADVDKRMPKFQNSKRAVVIGSGFVALQAAWAACYRGMKVTVIELMDRIMPSVLDQQGADVLVEKIHEKGVTLHTGTVTERIEKLEDGSFLVHLKDKEPVAADFVIVGTGVRPNVAFLEGSGVTVERGIPVNEFMQTNVPDVYAAGDVAAGPTAFGDEHTLKLKISEREAKIKVLQSQISPHFLYNALDCINWNLIEKEDWETSRILIALSSMLRYSMEDSTDLVSVEQELQQVENYLIIQKNRFFDRFDYRIEKDQAVMAVLVPKMILQPIVENSIRHGLEEKNDGMLVVRVAQREYGLEILVEDNGAGIPQKRLEKLRQCIQESHQFQDEQDFHIGLANVNSRLRYVFGNSSGLSIESRENEYARVRLIVDLEGMQDETADSGR